MPFTRQQKEEKLEIFKQNLEKQNAMIFVDFKGLSTPDISDIKKELKKLGAKFIVIKKKLFKIASQDVDKELSEKVGELEGQSAVIFSFEDEMATAKIVYNFARKNENLNIMGGFFEKLVRNKDEVIEFAKIPSKLELLARLVGSLKAPMSKLDNALIYNMRGLVVVLNQIKK